MNQTEIKIIKDKTFEVIKSAVNQMVDIIRPTFGPASNKVIIDKYTHRIVVDDGVQVARDFKLEDPTENAIVNLIRETAIKTNDRVGDGTTNSLIILQAIINEIGRRTKIDGRKIEIELKQGLKEVKEHLLKRKKEINSKEELKKVALTAFNNEKIAEMLSDTYYKIGKNGIITIETTPAMETTIEMTNGIKINKGYISPYMINNSERMETEILRPYILLTDYRLTENSDIISIMEKMAKERKFGLVIIADNIEQQALATLVINLPQVMNPQTQKLGTFPSVAISAPYTDIERKLWLEDIALMTGATVFSVEKGSKLEEITIDDLGRADKFICRQDESIIVNPKGDKKDRLNAIINLKKLIKNEIKQKKKEELEKRLGLFTNSLAVIKVGASTESEQKSLKYKVEDAVHSIKSAFINGVVCGSGRSLLNIKTSSDILNNALQYPHRQLLENMGLDSIINYSDDNEVFNVITEKIGNFMDVGVIDPVDVLLAGIESAVSIASILITSSGIIIEHKSKNEQ